MKAAKLLTALISLTIYSSAFVDGFCQSPSPAEIARSSVVYIYFDVTDPATGAKSTIQGTGFVVSKSGHVLTASHLFREWKNQRDVDKTQNEIRGSLRGKVGTVTEAPLILGIVKPGDADFEDVALLKLPDTGKDYGPAPVCMHSSSDNPAPALGDSFFAYGFPKNNNFQPVSGILGLNDATGGRWSASSAFTFGMSGGPVYTIKGIVMGLVKGGLDGTDAVQWITPIQFAAPLLLMASGFSEVCVRPDTLWSLDNCRPESEAAQREFANDSSQIPRVEKLIQCKNPIGYELKGSERFYKGDYQNAEKEFILAVNNLPPQAREVKPMWQSDLADTYIETGKISEAIDLYQQILTVNSSDSNRLGLARAYLYRGRDDPTAYVKAVELLRGVDPAFRGMSEPGIVPIILAAAQTGQTTKTQMAKKQKQAATIEAKKNLCTGINQAEPHWRSILNGTATFLHASFKEEISLLKEIGGGKVSCPS
jgi:tetratricopeptide (TPR) repeat protein